MTRLTILFALVILFKENCGQHQTFTKNGIFKVPSNVHWVRVVAVGGGGGGTHGYMPGGAGGYVKCITLRVTPNQEYGIVVGKGGKGSNSHVIANNMNNSPQDCSNGSQSFFANLLAAPGGGSCSGSFTGVNGGTGSGAACWAHYGGNCRGSEGMGGRGGSGGSNGGYSSDGSNGGNGQGREYLSCLATAKRVSLTAGEGGNAVDANCKDRKGECWGAGSGGGGVLVNGQGPAAYDGQAPDIKLAGEGGKGYGAGGGGGGYRDVNQIPYYFSGGNGIDGMVHVEWN